MIPSEFLILAVNKRILQKVDELIKEGEGSVHLICLFSLFVLSFRKKKQFGESSIE